MGGRRGPARMPSAVARASGYKRRKGREIGGKEPRPSRNVSAPPKAITTNKDAKKCWDAVLPHLQRMKVMTGADEIALQGLCRAWAIAQTADREIDTRGLMLTDDLGRYHANPAISISRQAWIEVRKFAQEFGLTPSARTRVREIEDDPKDEGKATEESAEDFIFGTGGRVVGSIGA